LPEQQRERKLAEQRQKQLDELQKRQLEEQQRQMTMLYQQQQMGMGQFGPGGYGMMGGMGSMNSMGFAQANPYLMGGGFGGGFGSFPSMNSFAPGSQMGAMNGGGGQTSPGIQPQNTGDSFNQVSSFSRTCLTCT
jgi:hypothetical protein